ncbi:ABC transporter permease subunit [Candidatus Peregrinibacteria bacterium]|nr:MAG: ABC transporter permease subunit [Candidatus Peregrinibacteria bacterium]
MRGYFNAPLAYIFLTVFLTVSSWLYFRDFFLNDIASMRSYFSLIPWIFLLLIPAITMRLWAEEKKMGTLEVLLVSPITDWQAVLGKFFASLAFLSIAVLLSLILPLLLLIIGQPDWGMIVGGYVGLILLGATYLSIGLWVSSLTDNQIIAFIFLR